MEKISEHSPLISVVIPLYNGGKYIEETLHSVLAQSYVRYEILVVDDGSSDDGPSKVFRFVELHPEHIRLLRHPDSGNHGITASRNLAIRNAKGSYVAFVDQDDLWLPQKLERQMESLQCYPEAALVYAKTIFIDKEGHEIRLGDGYSTYGKGIAGIPRNVFGKLIQEDFIPNLTVLVRKSSLDRVGLFDEGPRFEYEDWLLLSKLAFFEKFLFIPEVLAKWRLHDSNYSAHIFHTGQFSQAEEHCTIALFSYLLNASNVTTAKARKYLRRRIWRLLLRARSWGVTTATIREHAAKLMKAFPLEQYTVQVALGITLLIHPGIASILRRMRRKLVGV